MPRRPDIDRFALLAAHGASLIIPTSPLAGAEQEVGKVPTLNTAARMYLNSIKPQVTRGTWVQRRYHLERFLHHAGGTTRVRAVKKKHIEAYLASMEVSVGTLKQRYLPVRGLFDFAVERRWIKYPPYQGIKLPRQPHRQPRSLTFPQIQQLAAVIPDNRGRVILALAFFEGLRRVEIARLELGDIDFQQRTIRVLTAKSGAEDILPLSDWTGQRVDAYLTERGKVPGPLIQSYNGGGGLTPAAIGNLVSHWMTDAGIKDGAFDGVSLHACRHTAAVRMLEAGARPEHVQHALRHASLSSTWTYLKTRRNVEEIRGWMGAPMAPPPGPSTKELDHENPCRHHRHVRSRGV